MKQSHLPTILIIDDDRVNRTLLAEVLKDECRILLAKDGITGLAVLRQENVSLVLLDVSMPGMNGYDVLREIQNDPLMRELPVIFITGFTDTKDEERGLLMGATDYVQKPIRAPILRARVRLHLKLANQRKELERLSRMDGLTGIGNRRMFDHALDDAIGHCARTQLPLALAIFDIDHFKQFNDLYGHGAGDAALRQVAQTLRSFGRRGYDLIARYGGEEFVLLLPGTGAIASLLESIRSAVMETCITHDGSTTASVLTISGGAVVGVPRPTTKAQTLLDLADRLLYQAKATGRNRIAWEAVVLHDEPPPRTDMSNK